MIYQDQNMLTLVIEACEGAGSEVAVIVPGNGTLSAPGVIVLRLDTVSMWRQYDETKSDPVPRIDVFAQGAPPVRFVGRGVPELGRLLSERFVR